MLSQQNQERKVPRMTPPSIVLKEVLEYKNNAVVHRLVEKSGFSKEEAEGIFQDTLRFLSLCGLTEREHPLAPPELIDEGWHTFILFTEDYADFCARYFGKFIHHRPRRPEDLPGDGTVIRQTKELALATFGTLSNRWEYHAPMSECSPSTNCQDPPPEDCATNQ